MYMWCMQMHMYVKVMHVEAMWEGSGGISWKGSIFSLRQTLPCFEHTKQAKAGWPVSLSDLSVSSSTSAGFPSVYYDPWLYFGSSI